MRWVKSAIIWRWAGQPSAGGRGGGGSTISWRWQVSHQLEVNESAVGWRWVGQPSDGGGWVSHQLEVGRVSNQLEVNI